MADNAEFVQSIRDATAKIALDMEKKVSQACLVVEGEARQLCPVDQGHLRASITSETEITANEIIGRIGSNLEYAPYVHNGTGIYACLLYTSNGTIRRITILRTEKLQGK